MSTDVYPYSLSRPSSPQSSGLPSPPSSPGSSFSSLPSDAFSLSVPSSPPRHDSPLPAHSLILPSLSLGTNGECAQNLHGEALGHLHLLILGARGSGKTLVAETLVHGNPDVVDVGQWVDDPAIGRVLSAETRMEGETMGASGNVRLVETMGFDQTDDPDTIVNPILDAIRARFRAVVPLLSQSHPPDRALRDLLASSQSPFFTAVLLLTSCPPTPLETSLLSKLATHIPVISIPSPSLPHASRSSSRARTRRATVTAPSFRSSTPAHLRTTLFRRPAALHTLRRQAAERFLWWREVETAKHQTDPLDKLLGNRQPNDDLPIEKWDWEARLSHDVALARAAMEPKMSSPSEPHACPPYANLSFDPLHIPSLFLLSLSILRPLRDSVVARLRIGVRTRWFAATVISAFCAGVGVGYLLRSA
ncbi:hypothetical protein K439DRAFT_1664680 [Ramaria rubella]|nr:hypothetical protein K439DRAFT_1664680 [Ramaria rubella]